MEIAGRWHEFRDGITRPVVDAKVQRPDGDWEDVVFLLDSGADRTIFEAGLLSVLAPLALPEEDSPQIGGVGGITACRFVQTKLSFDRSDGKPITVNGVFGVFTDVVSSDVSVLGRDVTNNFDVIYSYPQREVFLLASPHSYTVQLPF